MGVCRPIQPGTGYGYPLQAILRLHGREPGRCGWYCLVRVGQVGLGERWRSRTKSPDEGDGVLTASSVGCVVGEGEGSDRRLRREQQLVPDVDPDTEEEETMWLEAARRPRNNGEQWHNWGGPQAREDQRGPVEGGKMGEKQTEQPESRREDLPWANWRDIVPWPASRRAIAPGLTQGRRGPGSGWHGWSQAWLPGRTWRVPARCSTDPQAHGSRETTGCMAACAGRPAWREGWTWTQGRSVFMAQSANRIWARPA